MCLSEHAGVDAWLSADGLAASTDEVQAAAAGALGTLPFVPRGPTYDTFLARWHATPPLEAPASLRCTDECLTSPIWAGPYAYDATRLVAQAWAHFYEWDTLHLLACNYSYAQVGKDLFEDWRRRNLPGDPIGDLIAIHRIAVERYREIRAEAAKAIFNNSDRTHIISQSASIHHHDVQQQRLYCMIIIEHGTVRLLL